MAHSRAGGRGGRIIVGALLLAAVLSNDTFRSLALSAAARWSERDMSGGDLFEAPGYGVWDLFATQRLGEGMRLRAGQTDQGAGDQGCGS